MDAWASDFDSWDICGLVCSSLFDRTPNAWSKAEEWSSSEREFVKRAGFALMAALAVHDKAADDRDFLVFLRIIIRESGDEKNYVKKAVNLLLRQIRKRSPMLNRKAIKAAEGIALKKGRASKWIASDALRELRSSRL